MGTRWSPDIFVDPDFLISSGGQQANEAGLKFENEILKDITKNLEQRGWKNCLSVWSEANRYLELWLKPDRLYHIPMDNHVLYQVKFGTTSITGADRRADFFMWTPKNSAWVEARFQESDGSVDQKYVGTFLDFLGFPSNEKPLPVPIQKYLVVGGRNASALKGTLIPNFIDLYGGRFNTETINRLLSGEIKVVDRDEFRAWHRAFIGI